MQSTLLQGGGAGSSQKCMPPCSREKAASLSTALKHLEAGDEAEHHQANARFLLTLLCPGTVLFQGACSGPIQEGMGARA